MSFRDEIRGMPGEHSEAAEYLTSIIDAMTEALDYEVIPDCDVHMTPSERRFFNALLRAGDAGLTLDALMTAMYHERFGKAEPDMSILRVFATRLRNKLQGTPYQIKKVYGQGYLMEVSK